jgi:hypothetical protein
VPYGVGVQIPLSAQEAVFGPLFYFTRTGYAGQSNDYLNLIIYKIFLDGNYIAFYICYEMSSVVKKVTTLEKKQKNARKRCTN